jgi:hypothetical protein
MSSGTAVPAVDSGEQFVEHRGRISIEMALEGDDGVVGGGGDDGPEPVVLQDAEHGGRLVDERRIVSGVGAPRRSVLDHRPQSYRPGGEFG